MASISRVIGMFVFCIVSSACSPLQQAPLVYSSKISVGVDVAATATEQPGLSASIGVKTVDAAYVPVAVAKPCDFSSRKDVDVNCTESIYQLKPISGSNQKGSSSETSDDIARQSIANFKRLSDARAEVNKEYYLAEGFTNEIKNSIENKIKEDGVKAGVIEEKIKKGEVLTSDESVFFGEYSDNLKKYNLAIQKQDEIKRRRDEINSSYQNFDVNSLLNALSVVDIGNDKVDSYSVFGSFDSNTKVGGESGSGSPNVQADLSLGKVFSTGVASQYLTEGMSKYYENSGIALVERAKAKADCMAIGTNYIESYKTTLDVSSPDDKKRLSKMYEDIISSCNR